MAKGKSGRAMTPTDFMPQFNRRRQSTDEVGHRLMALAQASHGKLAKGAP